MSTISFIIPTWKYFANPFKLQPLLEMYFATHLRESFPEMEVDCVDLRSFRRQKEDESISFEDFCDSRIPERDMYIYWSPKTADSCELDSIVEFLRKKHPNAVHVAGGTHIDQFPEESMLVYDAVINGPGERAMSQIVNEHFSGKGLEKKLYKDSWSEVYYKDFPVTRRDFLPPESIVNTELFEKYGSPLGTSVLLSRGCPFKCAFCVYNVPNTMQLREPKDIEKEINYLKEDYGVTAINLRDEICVGLSERRYVPFLEAIGNCNVMWRGQTRTGIKKHMFALAKETGCVELDLGVESPCQDVLDAIKKQQTVEQCEDSIRWCKELGIKARINLILGLPNEPKDIVDQCIKFIERNEPDYASVSGLCPVPGSDMFKNPSKYGIKIIDRNWQKHAHLMFRFGDEEDHGLPFDYDDSGFTRSEIAKNVQRLQQYLRDNDMTY